MFQIPQHILDDLKCSVCSGYLSSKPLMIKPENDQVCGKCFMIIPSEEKEKCLRQLALESLASVFLFPCRYHRQGCKYNFPWDGERNHEETCPYRYNTPYRNSTGSDFFNNQLFIKSQSNYDINQNNYTREDYQNLNYLNIQGAVKNETNTSELQNNINLSIEGAVSPKIKPEINYSDIIVEEHVYDSLTPLINKFNSKRQCFNCKALLGEEVFNCSLGHLSCGNCKGSMCMVCVNLLEKETRTLCKYHQNGCKEVLRHEETNKHQSNCTYREIQCLFEPCKYKNIIGTLKSHIKECHPDKMIPSHELTRTFFARDESMVFLCYDRVFKFVYYYYKAFVEFFVIFVGSSEEATEYFYEISLEAGDEFFRKRSKCASWNDSMLAKGITFDRKDLVNGNKKVSFEVLVKIYQVG